MKGHIKAKTAIRRIGCVNKLPLLLKCLLIAVAILLWNSSAKLFVVMNDHTARGDLNFTIDIPKNDNESLVPMPSSSSSSSSSLPSSPSLKEYDFVDRTCQMLGYHALTCLFLQGHRITILKFNEGSRTNGFGSLIFRVLENQRFYWEKQRRLLIIDDSRMPNYRVNDTHGMFSGLLDPSFVVLHRDDELQQVQREIVDYYYNTTTSTSTSKNNNNYSQNLNFTFQASIAYKDLVPHVLQVTSPIPVYNVSVMVQTQRYRLNTFMAGTHFYYVLNRKARQWMMEELKQKNSWNSSTSLVPSMTPFVLDTFNVTNTPDNIFTRDLVLYFAPTEFPTFVQDFCHSLPLSNDAWKRIWNILLAQRQDQQSIPIPIQSNNNNDTTLSVGFHIRRGDKLDKESRPFDELEYIQSLLYRVPMAIHANHCYVTTDDIDAVQIPLQQALNKSGMNCSLWTMSTNATRSRSSVEDTFFFLAELKLLEMVDVFVGSFNSNAGRYVAMTRGCQRYQNRNLPSALLPAPTFENYFHSYDVEFMNDPSFLKS